LFKKSSCTNAGKHNGVCKLSNNQKTFDFLENREIIIQEIRKKGPEAGIDEPISLINGFIQQPIQQDLFGAVVEGPTVPIVAAVGNKSSRIYFFALKALIPSLTKDL
jgi:hypothetical protein